VIITLTWYEQLLAGWCGHLRYIETIREGYHRPPFAKHHDEDPHASETTHAGAEMAVAKALKKYWLAGVNTHDEPDVAPDIEVRCTSNPNGRLIVRPEAHPERRFVLVRGTMPTFDIVGWILAADAMKPKWLDNPKGKGLAYWVPAECLHPMPEKKAEAAA
jgi:hypothetical protein